MALKGDLASVDLAQVFQMLALNQKVGLLSIQSPTAWKALYFDQRGVTFFYNEHVLVDNVLTGMVRTGLLMHETVQEARDHAARTETTVVDCLLAGGFIAERDLDGAFRRELEEEIYDLFFWRDARFEFYESATSFPDRDGVINERYFFSTDSMIMEAARRIDEWSFIQERVPSAFEVYQAITNTAQILELDDSTLTVLDLIDGKRNVERLIEVTGLAPFHVYKHLALLLDSEVIADVEPVELVPSAQECVAEGRIHDAINLYEKAISIGEGLPHSHALAAQAYEAIQEFELTAYHLKCVAEHHAGEAETGKAVEILHRVVELIPTDLEARERLTELTVGDPQFRGGSFDAVAEGKLLVDLYLEVGEIERVRGILERLLRDNPGDIELKKSLVNVHTKAGDTKRVVELYESIADDMVRTGQPIEAVKYLQKILMIDRSRRDVSDRVRSLYEMDERRRNRRRSLAAVGSLFVIVSILACVWYFYEQHAREHFDRIEVVELVEAREFGAAVQVYESFLESYPLTLVARDAKAAIARIDAQRLQHEAELKNRQRAIEAELNGIRSGYKLAFDTYRAEFEAQNLDGALAALEDVRKRVASAAKLGGGDADVAWARNNMIERKRMELVTHLSEAAALDRSARDHLRAGRWREARKQLLRLIDGYGMTRVARDVRLPVLVDSRPTGARILQGGEPLRTEVDGRSVELRTPAVIRCEASAKTSFALERSGFEGMAIEVDAATQSEARFVLTVIPSARIEFSAAVTTRLGVGSGFLAAGLSGGQLGITRIGDKATRRIKLPGLREVASEPVIARDRILYVGNDDRLDCLVLPTAKRVFSVKLESPPTHPPVVQDGRIFFGDEIGQLICLNLSNGARLWKKILDGGVGGPPTVHQRVLRVGTTAGDYFIFDAATGRRLTRMEAPTGIRSSVHRIEQKAGIVVFATSAGEVVGLDERTGVIAWRVGIGRVPKPSELAVGAGGAVYVVGGAGELRKINAATGAELSRIDLPGVVLSGPVLYRDQVFVVIREKLGEGQTRDELLAIQADPFEVAWEYRGEGILKQPVVAGTTGVFLPDAQSSVRCFQ